MLLVILNGGIDLSVGSIVGLTGAVIGNLFRGVQIPLTEIYMYPEVWVIFDHRHRHRDAGRAGPTAC